MEMPEDMSSLLKVVFLSDLNWQVQQTWLLFSPTPSFLPSTQIPGDTAVVF